VGRLSGHPLVALLARTAPANAPSLRALLAGFAPAGAEALFFPAGS
jgi:hypothetical protein